jgi:acetoin:2,6-dichlorophenolindophenol oxidoreductase subunit alpha
MAEVVDRPPDEALRTMYRLMIRIRRFEEELVRLFKRGKLPGFVHLYIGEEAIAAGVCSALRDDDRITSTHRGHGHLIAKGASLDGMMAELFGRIDGLCHGKGGSMHAVEFSLGVLGTNGIVGGGIPIATGAAWGDKQLGRDNVTVCFFGDGAANQGVLLEGFNLAAIWGLPVIFCCENNQYTEWTPTTKLAAGRIAERSHPFGIPGERVDGNDAVAVHQAISRAVDRARASDGPSFLECVTYRHHGHNEGEEAFSGKYRPDDEIATWKARDPIPALRSRIEGWGVMTPGELDEIDVEERDRVKAAAAFAEQSPWPDPDDALVHCFSDYAVPSGRIAS